MRFQSPLVYIRKYSRNNFAAHTLKVKLKGSTIVLLMPPKDADETANSKDIDHMIWVCTVKDPDETANSKDIDQMIWVCTVKDPDETANNKDID